MYIDKTYPFEPIPCPNFCYLDNCLGKESLLIHYNDIYLSYIRKLNELLSRYPSLQKSSLDELIYNNNNINIIEKNELLFLTSNVYNHHVYFSSLSTFRPNNQNYEVIYEINKHFGSFDAFKQKFKMVARGVTNGFVYLVCDETLRLSIFKTDGYNTPIPYNLYPLLCIDMWEHSYYLRFKVDKESYIDNFLNVLNLSHINSEFLECKKCIL